MTCQKRQRKRPCRGGPQAFRPYSESGTSPTSFSARGYHTPLTAPSFSTPRAWPTLRTTACGPHRPTWGVSPSANPKTPSHLLQIYDRCHPQQLMPHAARSAPRSSRMWRHVTTTAGRFRCSCGSSKLGHSSHLDAYVYVPRRMTSRGLMWAAGEGTWRWMGAR